MNKKFVAMSAMSLMLSVSFSEAVFAEAVAPVAPVNDVPQVAPATPDAPSVVDAGNGGVTKKMLGEVTVTSTTIDDRFESKRGEASNISNISGKKVDEEHGKNIVDVLESIPGVTAEVQSGDSVKIMLRGVEAQRYMGEKPGVAIVIDGVPVLERTGRVNIDLDNIDSIKVIKGGASYLFGEDALSGAVIITTKRGAKMAGYTVSAEAGSFGYKKGLARVGFTKGDFVGHIQASKASSDDYYDQGAYSRQYVDGKLQYLIDETSDVTFGFENSIRAKDSHGTVRGVTQAKNDPRSASPTAGKDFARKYDIDLNKLNLAYAKDFGDSSNLLVNTYSFTDHTYGWSSPSGFLRNASCPNTSVAALPNCNMSNIRDAYVSGVDTKQVQRGMKAEWRKGGEKVGVMSGLDLQHYEEKSLSTNLVNYTSRNTPVGPANLLNLAGTVTSNNLSTSDTKALYGEFKWQFAEPLTATFNARYDNILAKYSSNIPLTAPQIAQGRTTVGQKTFNVWSERAGLNYALAEDREVYSNISTGFRVPTLSQLYGGTISPTGSVAANPNLKPEQSINYEIGMRGKSELMGVPLDTDIAIFQLDRKDFILNTGGQYQTSPTGVTEQYQNIGGVRNRGLELGAKTDSRETWSGDLAYTYLRAVFTRNDTYWMTMGPRSAPLPSVLYNNTGKTVPRSPAHKINLTTRYRATSELSFTGEMNAQSGSYADEVNVVWVGGRTVFNLMANYEVKTESGFKWSAFARLDNAFNRYYYSTIRGSSDSDGNGVYNAEDPSITVNPGRVWTAGVSAKF